MYVLPKGLESAWIMARGKGWVFTFGRYGEPLLTAIGMGMVMVRARVAAIVPVLDVAVPDRLQSTYQVSVLAV